MKHNVIGVLAVIVTIKYNVIGVLAVIVTIKRNVIGVLAVTAMAKNQRHKDSRDRRHSRPTSDHKT